jgi:hypothetical protein
VIDAADVAVVVDDAVVDDAVVDDAVVVEIGCCRKYSLRAFSNSVKMNTSKEMTYLHNSHDANDDHTGDKYFLSNCLNMTNPTIPQSRKDPIKRTQLFVLPKISLTCQRK